MARLLTRETTVPTDLETTFAFFADARNLERITPPWLEFRVLTPEPIAMRTGTRIDYKLKVHGIPIGWRSLISAWEPPYRFVDEQIKGPYRQWIHEHTFEAVEGGTLVRDRVRYMVPGGALVDRWIVAPDLRKIFDYRQKVMREEMGRVTRPEISSRSHHLNPDTKP